MLAWIRLVVKGASAPAYAALPRSRGRVRRAQDNPSGADAGPGEDHGDRSRALLSIGWRRTVADHRAKLTLTPFLPHDLAE
jgi:hypothetical protein